MIIAGTITSVCMAFPCIYAVLIESYPKAQEVVTQHEQLDSVLA